MALPFVSLFVFRLLGLSLLFFRFYRNLLVNISTNRNFFSRSPYIRARKSSLSSQDFPSTENKEPTAEEKVVERRGMI